MDRNALDWIFSTAPQALAAFVGLIFAGVALMNNAIDNRIISNPDMKVIYEGFKSDTLKKLMNLLWGASGAIVLDIAFLSVTPLMEQTIIPPFIIFIIVFLLGIYNIIVLIWAINFIKNILDPDTFNEIIQKLLDESKARLMSSGKTKNIVDEGNKKELVNIGTFLIHYGSDY